VKHHAHLIEERLFDCYLAERGSEPIDPRLAEHLADCEACAARYADLAAFMDALHDEGVAETNDAFTPERLRAQQQQIARRLEHIGHPAKVLSFPRRFVSGTIRPASAHPTPRWLAATAAAGLFIGVAVGASYNFNGSFRQSAQRADTGPIARHSSANRLSTPTPTYVVATDGRVPVAVASDDAVLSDLETAMERPHTRALMVFDALTPHVREVDLRP
jgi:anti-sigma factor RsiW